jgi:uncharacterized membrane protein YdbT with pleckstrin-like domain
MIDLEKNETILLQARRHWFFLVTKLFALLPLVIISFVIIFFTESSGAEYFSFTQKNGTAFIVFLLFTWLLFLWVIAFIMWTNFYLDVLIVTDHRIINIEQKALFARETSSLHLDKVQDVSVEVFGLLATFLSFGNLKIQTAGEVGEFIIKGIKNPDATKQTILEQHEKAMTKLRTVRIEND